MRKTTQKTNDNRQRRRNKTIPIDNTFIEKRLLALGIMIIEYQITNGLIHLSNLSKKKKRKLIKNKPGRIHGKMGPELYVGEQGQWNKKKNTTKHLTNSVTDQQTNRPAD